MCGRRGRCVEHDDALVDCVVTAAVHSQVFHHNPAEATPLVHSANTGRRHNRHTLPDLWPPPSCVCDVWTYRYHDNRGCPTLPDFRSAGPHSAGPRRPFALGIGVSVIRSSRGRRRRAVKTISLTRRLHIIARPLVLSCRCRVVA
jgi:hypothetical protein